MTQIIVDRLEELFYRVYIVIVCDMSPALSILCVEDCIKTFIHSFLVCLVCDKEEMLKD